MEWLVDLQQRVDALEVRVEDLQAQVTELKTRVAYLEDRVTDLEQAECDAEDEAKIALLRSIKCVVTDDKLSYILPTGEQVTPGDLEAWLLEQGIDVHDGWSCFLSFIVDIEDRTSERIFGEVQDRVNAVLDNS